MHSNALAAVKNHIASLREFFAFLNEWLTCASSPHGAGVEGGNLTKEILE